MHHLKKPMSKELKTKVATDNNGYADSILDSVFKEKDPNKDDIYVALSGTDFEVDTYNFGQGIHSARPMLSFLLHIWRHSNNLSNHVTPARDHGKQYVVDIMHGCIMSFIFHLNLN